MWHFPWHDMHVGFLLCKMGEAYGVTTLGWASQLGVVYYLFEVGVCVLYHEHTTRSTQ